MTRFLLFCSVLAHSWVSPNALANSLVLKDFGVKVFHGDQSKPHLWAIELQPPTAHHFNLQAPRSASGGKVKFNLTQEQEHRLLFQTTDASLINGSVIEVQAFLCDDLKTYCLKKKMQLKLDGTLAKSISKPFEKESPKSSNPLKEKKGDSKKTMFFENDASAAIAEAVRTGKPLLIDFYGIWCPPCNLYNETIFNTQEFQVASRKFVLLKMDADLEKSFPFKSQFKVGGYPTLILAKAFADASIEEFDRIVGYYPSREFFELLNVAYARRNDALEKRWSGRLDRRLEMLLEQKEYDEVIRWQGTDSRYEIFRWVAESRKNPDFLKKPENAKKLSSVFDSVRENSKSLSPSILMKTIDLLMDESLIQSTENQKTAHALLDELDFRVDPKSHFVTGSELSAADVSSMRMGMMESLKDEAGLSRFRKQAIVNYEKMIRLFSSKGQKDLRSLNLEYAYLLWKDGRVSDAKKIYSRFISKYPKEFTFYFASAKMHLELKELDRARSLAENAFQHSYGDNRIRSLDRLLQVMKAQGEEAKALQRGNEFLKGWKSPEQGLQVRTGRYLEMLKKTLTQLNGAST